jgi:superoxide dismutase, Fe-Mn family
MKHFAIISAFMVIASFSTGQSRQQVSTLTLNAMKTISKSEFLPLPYAHDALEPHIDKLTMEIHHGKHHKAYYDNLLAAAKGTEAENKSLLEVFSEMSTYPASIRNNGGGYYNHNLFWQILSPQGGGLPQGDLAKAIDEAFGGFEQFKALFTDAAKTRFGSGWAWLATDNAGKLFVSSTPNQDNPLMDIADKKGTPVLALDVWEHAYYLHYQNRRPDYVSSFWNIVNWAKVSELYAEALQK